MQIIYLNPGQAIAEFKLEGALGTLESQAFLDKILPELDKVTGVILECTDMPYMTSTGLRVIMTVGKNLKSKNQKLVLCGLQGLALQVFEASGFGKVFIISSSLDVAREVFS